MAQGTKADELAKGQKEISVAEFFERNRQVLGFDSPTKALITATKEAVDNALDACEEAGILPDIVVEVRKGNHPDELVLAVEDNGPGIVKKQLPKIFGQLLYGSRFHAIRQSRGQQGIGISAVVLYGQLTTGEHALITSKVGQGHPAVRIELGMDTKRNLPEVHSTEARHWEKESGTRIEVAIKARYQGGKQSVFEFLRATSIVNPHARLTFLDPNGERTLFERTSDEVPEATQEIKPHPLGTELGTVLKMARDAPQRKTTTWLQQEFSSIGGDSAKKILKEAGVENHAAKDLTRDECRRIYNAFAKVKIMAPPTDCLSPIGPELIKRGLKKETEDVSPEFITTVTRPPAVWGGHPFQVEVGIVYGGTLPKDQQVRVLRFANRVPLLYQQGACEGTLGVQGVDWRRYGLEQRGGRGTPVGPAIVLVHVASTKVPFTSEAKEAIAPMEEIHKEIKLALQVAARGLGRHMKKKAKRAKVSEKFDLVTKLLPEINRKSAHMLGKPEADLAPIVCKIMDVVWIDDPKVEYEKLEGQTVEAVAVAPRPVPNGDGTMTLSSFDADTEEPPEGDGEEQAVAPPSPPTKPRQAYLARATIAITNYKLKPSRFRLYAVLPDGAALGDAEPAPKRATDRWVVWDVPVMKPTEQREIVLRVGGVEKGALDDLEVYVEGISDLAVVGADPWHGGDE